MMPYKTKITAENNRKMLNGKGLKPEALLSPHLDVTVLWYHNMSGAAGRERPV